MISMRPNQSMKPPAQRSYMRRIDFVDHGGKQTSYRANPGFLANLKNMMRRRIDARFRKYFETFTP
jgi:hypothetical protein